MVGSICGHASEVAHRRMTQRRATLGGARLQARRRKPQISSLLGVAHGQDAAAGSDDGEVRRLLFCIMPVAGLQLRSYRFGFGTGRLPAASAAPHHPRGSQPAGPLHWQLGSRCPVSCLTSNQEMMAAEEPTRGGAGNARAERGCA